MKTILVKDIKKGDFIKDVGLVNSIKFNDRNKIQLELVPFHLEYYGMNLSRDIELDEEVELFSKEKTLKYVEYCFSQIESAEKDFIEALSFYTSWKESNKKPDHNDKSRPFNKMSIGDLTKHGLVVEAVKPCDFGMADKIKLISGSNYQIFTYCYIVDIRDEESEGFDKMTDILNDDIESINKFIESCEESIQCTSKNINSTKTFLENVKCQNTTQE